MLVGSPAWTLLGAVLAKGVHAAFPYTKSTGRSPSETMSESNAPTYQGTGAPRPAASHLPQTGHARVQSDASISHLSRGGHIFVGNFGAAQVTRPSALPLLSLGNEIDAPGYDGVGSGFTGWWRRLTSACDAFDGDADCTLWKVEHALLPAPRCPVDCRLAPRPTSRQLLDSDGVLQWQTKANASSVAAARPPRTTFCIESETGTWRVPPCSSTTRVFASRPDAEFRFSWFSRYYMPDLGGPSATGNHTDGSAAALLAPAALQRAQFQLNSTPPRNIISVWFRHCHTDRGSGMPHRAKLLQRLRAAGIRYASYGICGRNVAKKDPVLDNAPQHHLRNKDLGLRRHPFTLVAENSAHPGWVTEKVYQALAAGVVPVWMGSPPGWAERYLLPIVPAGSVVVASQYPSLAALAHFLKRAATNATLYQDLHRWRHDPRLVRESIAMLRGELDIAFEATPCRICRVLHL